MEALLSVAFDNLSCRDGAKVRKGLRQIDGLLAQICLSRRNLSAADKRRSIASPLSPATTSQQKELNSLKDDPAFREFFKLQEGFEWNLAIRIINCLDKLLGKGSTGQNDLLIVSALNVLQGILLLHPPSRALFSRDIYMNLLLDLLDSPSCPAVQSGTLSVLVTALLNQPANTRAFESLDGFLTLTAVLHQRSETSRDVRTKLAEFVSFYLLPETPSLDSGNSSLASSCGNAPSTPLRRSESRLMEAFAKRPASRIAEEDTRTVAEKRNFLQRYVSNLEEFEVDMSDNGPFGEDD
ncbi:MAG: hypothetical protein M1814_002681 [Vezdaea aestivalis]|nr:MAG: hypothetical protein M1814_002681 [Vezdaea aestivalis]